MIFFSDYQNFGAKQRSDFFSDFQNFERNKDLILISDYQNFGAKQRFDFNQIAEITGH